MHTAERSMAVIGSGIAGLVAGYVVSARDRVNLFEADTQVGGHDYLMRLGVPIRSLVNSGGIEVANSGIVTAEMAHSHPMHTAESVAAQRLLPTSTEAKAVPC